MKPLTTYQKAALKKKQAHQDNISKAISNLPTDAKGNVSLGAVAEAIKTAEKAAPEKMFTVDMASVEKKAFNYLVQGQAWTGLSGSVQLAGYAKALAVVDETILHPVEIIEKALDAKSTFGKMWSDGILQSVFCYLIYSAPSSNPTHSTEKFFAEKAMEDAIKILIEASENFTDLALSYSLDHAVVYLQGNDVTAMSRFTLSFFELDESFNPLPLVQLGMLGREDGPLSKKEGKLKKSIIVDGKIMDDPNVKLLKCCDGEGEHEYEDGDTPDCECVACDCGCIADSEDVHKCTNCGACQGDSGCCACVSCDSCGEMYSIDDICGNCEQCSDCCQNAGDCWVCDSCEKTYDGNDIGGCDYCGHCEKCCDCVYCESCECHHPNDWSMCSSCNSCDEHCSCTNCKSCGVEEGDLDDGIGYCNDCHHCGSCGCICLLLKIPKARFYETTYVPKTQKAKGLEALRYYSATYPVPDYTLQKVEGSNPATLSGKFVRPCPMTPRHGFVDSRMVLNAEDGSKIIEETLKADPEAEFIVMSKLNAECSGIWTPGKLIIGPGNDGATAGHGSHCISVAGDMFWAKGEMLERAGIKDSVYAEMLWVPAQGSGRGVPTHYFVQLRDGPKLPETIDHIPNEMLVKNVIMAEGDLLEWETKMKNQPEGTVVSHPGGSLASHYAVHAVLNHIPVLISREPVIGEILAPTQDGELKPDIEAIRRGFYHGMMVETDYKSATYMMLLGVHSTTKWLGKHDVLLGAALGLAYRLIITAAVGEWRHRPTGKIVKLERESVYERVFSRITGKKRYHKKTLEVRNGGKLSGSISGMYMRALRDFRKLIWADGMGGDQWFQFTQWGAVILNSVLEGNTEKALAAMNNAVHASHNNGWGFNKFAASGAMDTVAKTPVHATTICAPLMYRILTRTEEQIQDADVWFAKRAKRLPIEKAKDWITQVPVTAANADAAQVRMIGPDLAEVEFKLAKNNRCYAKEIKKISPSIARIIEDLMALTGKDGRLLATFAPNDKGIYYRNIDLKKDDPARQFLGLYRETVNRWVAHNPHSSISIPITECPHGPEPPCWAQYTEQGTVVSVPTEEEGA